MAKLLLQKCLAGIPAAFSNSSKVSFLMLANLLVFKSVTMNDMIFGWTVSTSSGMGKILLPMKNWAYFALSFVQSFFFPFVPTRRLAFLAPFELAVSNWPGAMMPVMMMMVMMAIPVFFK